MLIKYLPSEYVEARPKVLARLQKQKHNFTVSEHSTHTEILVLSDKNKKYIFEKPHEGKLPKIALSTIRNLRIQCERAAKNWKINAEIYWANQQPAADCVVFADNIPTDASPDIWEIDIKGAYITALQKVGILDSDKNGDTKHIRTLRQNLQKLGYTETASEKICKKARLIAVGSLAKTLQVETYNYDTETESYSVQSEKIKTFDIKFSGINTEFCQAPPKLAERIARREPAENLRTPEQASDAKYNIIVAEDLFYVERNKKKHRAQRCKFAYYFDGAERLPVVVMPSITKPSDIFFGAKNIVSKDIDSMIFHASKNTEGIYIKWVDAIFCKAEHIKKISEKAEQLGYTVTVKKHKSIIFDTHLRIATVELEADSYKYELEENGAIVVNGKKTFNANGIKDKTIIAKIWRYVATADASILEAHIRKYKNISSPAHVRQALRKLGINTAEAAELATEETYLNLLKTPALLLGGIDTLLKSKDIELVNIDKKPKAEEYLKAVQKTRLDSAILQYYFEKYRELHSENLPEHYTSLDEQELRDFAKTVNYCVETGEYSDEVLRLTMQKLHLIFKTDEINKTLLF